MTFTFPPSGPVPLYANVPIHSDYYQPSRFEISDIDLGQTTIVTTSEDHNYVIGQTVRLLIPDPYGTYQLNYQQGYVISIPDDDQVEVNIDSSKYNSFISSPFVASITNITQASPGVITANNSFTTGVHLLLQDIGGMEELNDSVVNTTSNNSTTITLAINTSSFTAYSGGGTATKYPIDSRVPQIIAIGDVNSGPINTSGRTNNITFVPGSFIDISPN